MCRHSSHLRRTGVSYDTVRPCSSFHDSSAFFHSVILKATSVERCLSCVCRFSHSLSHSLAMNHCPKHARDIYNYVIFQMDATEINNWDEYGSMGGRMPHREPAGSPDDGKTSTVITNQYNYYNSINLDAIIDAIRSCIKQETEKATSERPTPTMDQPRDPNMHQREMYQCPGFGFHRGCEWGLCCVYSMWYNPNYRCSRERCAHKCRFYYSCKCHKFRHCGPSLLSDSIRSRAFDEYRRKHERGTHGRGDGGDPTLHNSTQTRRGRRHRRTCRQTSDQENVAPSVPGLPRTHDRIPSLPNNDSACQQRRYPSDPHSLPIPRERMGPCAPKRDASKRSKKIPVHSLGVATDLSRPRSHQTRKRRTHV